MNDSEPVSWLVISYFVNEDGTAASHHIDDRLAALRALKIPLTVLSSPCGVRSRDFPHVRIASLMPSGIRFEIRHFLRHKARGRFWFSLCAAVLLLPNLPFYLLEKLVTRLPSTWSWWLSAAPTALMLARLRRPALIYSTGGPWSAHLAAAFAARLGGVPLIVEFQDPPVYDLPRQGHDRRFVVWAQAYVRRTARVLVFLTAQAAADEAAAFGSQTVAIHPGARVITSATSPLSSDYFTIAHFGSLGGSRNLAGILDGLRLLFEQQPELSAVLRLELYGNSDRQVLQQVGGFSYPGVIRTMGKLPRNASVAAMQRAHALLLIQNADQLARDTIPSKAYEYVQLRRPVLALVYRNPELTRMLAELGHLPVENDDAVGIRDALTILVKKWRRGDLSRWGNESPYTPEVAALRLVETAAKCFQQAEKVVS